MRRGNFGLVVPADELILSLSNHLQLQSRSSKMRKNEATNVPVSIRYQLTALSEQTVNIQKRPQMY